MRPLLWSRAGRANNWDQDVLQLHPSTEVELDDDIPERGRVFLRQAIDSTRSPSGAVMLAASAVDALLKAKASKWVVCMNASMKPPLST